MELILIWINNDPDLIDLKIKIIEDPSRIDRIYENLENIFPGINLS